MSSKNKSKQQGNNSPPPNVPSNIILNSQNIVQSNIGHSTFENVAVNAETSWNTVQTALNEESGSSQQPTQTTPIKKPIVSIRPILNTPRISLELLMQITNLEELITRERGNLQADKYNTIIDLLSKLKTVTTQENLIPPEDWLTGKEYHHNGILMQHHEVQTDMIEERQHTINQNQQQQQIHSTKKIKTKFGDNNTTGGNNTLFSSLRFTHNNTVRSGSDISGKGGRTSGKHGGNQQDGTSPAATLQFIEQLSQQKKNTRRSSAPRRLRHKASPTSSKTSKSSKINLPGAGTQHHHHHSQQQFQFNADFEEDLLRSLDASEDEEIIFLATPRSNQDESEISELNTSIAAAVPAGLRHADFITKTISPPVIQPRSKSASSTPTTSLISSPQQQKKQQQHQRTLSKSPQNQLQPTIPNSVGAGAGINALSVSAGGDRCPAPDPLQALTGTVLHGSGSPSPSSSISYTGGAGKFSTSTSSKQNYVVGGNVSQQQVPSSSELTVDNLAHLLKQTTIMEQPLPSTISPSSSSTNLTVKTKRKSSKKKQQHSKTPSSTSPQNSLLPQQQSTSTVSPPPFRKEFLLHHHNLQQIHQQQYFPQQQNESNLSIISGGNNESSSSSSSVTTESHPFTNKQPSGLPKAKSNSKLKLDGDTSTGALQSPRYSGTTVLMSPRSAFAPPTPNSSSINNPAGN